MSCGKSSGPVQKRLNAYSSTAAVEWFLPWAPAIGIDDIMPVLRARAASNKASSLAARVAAGTYPKQTADVQTVGMDVLLLCRRELPDGLVYELTRALFEAVPTLEQAHEAASAIDVERGPTASIPAPRTPLTSWRGTADGFLALLVFNVHARGRDLAC